MNFYIDFEATQFSGYIISIGCVSEDGAQFSTLVAPVKGGINSFITKLTGITAADVRKAPTADQAFNNLFDWVMENGNDGTVPTFFCYGNSDSAFLDKTVAHMNDLRAMVFVLALKAQLIDYSQQASKFLHSDVLSLKKLYTLIKEEEIQQRHDALEDAEMLRFISQNLTKKDISAEALAQVKALSPPKPTKKKAPDFYQEWCDGLKYQFFVDTFADKDNYTLCCSKGGNVKYFNDYEVAALWCIKYHLVIHRSPKQESDVKAVIKNIKHDPKAFGYNWEEKKGR